MSEIINNNEQPVIETNEKEIENENDAQKKLEDVPDYIKYLYLLFDVLIVKNKYTGIYYLDPLYLYIMRNLSLMPIDFGFDVNLDEIKETLKLEVEMRNSYVNNVYSTISTIIKGIENYIPNKEDMFDLSELVKEIKNTKTEEVEEEKNNVPFYGKLNFSKKN